MRCNECGIEAPPVPAGWVQYGIMDDEKAWAEVTFCPRHAKDFLAVLDPAAEVDWPRR
jgi:hypothetical protein